MDKGIKTKWLSALRSGDYKQGQGALKALQGYCCLGVLCDVVDPYGWDDIYHEGHSQLPGTKVAAASGASLEFENLIDLNDNQNYSFNQIADYIEEKL